jgi:hypothetical protein
MPVQRGLVQWRPSAVVAHPRIRALVHEAAHLGRICIAPRATGEPHAAADSMCPATDRPCVPPCAARCARPCPTCRAGSPTLPATATPDWTLQAPPRRSMRERAAPPGRPRRSPRRARSARGHPRRHARRRGPAAAALCQRGRSRPPHAAAWRPRARAPAPRPLPVRPHCQTCAPRARPHCYKRPYREEDGHDGAVAFEAGLVQDRPAGIVGGVDPRAPLYQALHLRGVAALCHPVQPRLPVAIACKKLGRVLGPRLHRRDERRRRHVQWRLAALVGRGRSRAPL